MKFTESGEVQLTLSGSRNGEDAGRPPSWAFHIDVRDTGIGIDGAGMSRLFESFSQADASISRRYGGTGLGLAISRRLAEVMGGSLTATSDGVAGSGSTFHLTFLADAASGAIPRVPSHPADLAGRRALVVDDNAANRVIVMKLLERWGLAARATVTTRGPGLGDRWRKPSTSPSLDLHMPGWTASPLRRHSARRRPARRRPASCSSSLGVHERPTGTVSTFLVKPVKPSACTMPLPVPWPGPSVPSPADRPGPGWTRSSGHAIRCASCSPRTIP